MSKRLKLVSWSTLLAAILCLFQNCSNVKFTPQAEDNSSNTTGPVQDYSGSLVVSASHPNPPLDLFFVVDNSASMFANQISLGNAFAGIFQNNKANLANFDVNVYLISTNSTFAPSYADQIPTESLASVTSIPDWTDSADIQSIPGMIYALQNSGNGKYETAPFSFQLNPAAVPGFDQASGTVTPVLHISKQGNLSDPDYGNAVTTLTNQFKDRLNYLNPKDQFAYDPSTKISSGLCSIARVLKHSNDFISPGDAAAFVIVSDDNDRLNTNDDSLHQCIESVSSTEQVVDGNCGHNQTVFSYDSTDTITYQSDTKINYQTGTQINYTYTSGENCSVDLGYNYTSTYQQMRTTVTYTSCAQIADGTCVTPVPNTTVVLNNNYVTSSGACTQDMTSLVSPAAAAGTTFTCVRSDLTGQTGAKGVDTASDGTQCSSAVLATLGADKSRTNVNCVVGAANTTATAVNNQAVGSCANYCSAHSATYPKCTLATTTPINGTKASFTLPELSGLSCASTCPAGSSASCGTGANAQTIGGYIAATYKNGSCTGTAPVMDVLVVNAAEIGGAALTCSSSLSGLTVTKKTITGAVACAGASDIPTCLANLQAGMGTPTTGCSVSSSPDKATITADVNMICSSSCTGSNITGCDATVDANIGAFIQRTKKGLCLTTAAVNGGPKSLPALQFNTSVATVNCDTACSQTVSGSCDGNGYGATDGSTVRQYIGSLGGGTNTCSLVTSFVSAPTTVTIDAGAPGASGGPTLSSSCPSANPFFKAGNGGAHPASAVTAYVTGDATHKAADFQNFIVSESTAIFGAHNMPALAVIGHMKADTQVAAGTSVGTDYFNLAAAMGSTQITSVSDPYDQSLTAISDFIVQSTKNSYTLPVNTGAVVYSVSVVPNGSTVSTPLAATDWSWSGGTLSVSASLQIGDQILYQYHY